MKKTILIIFLFFIGLKAQEIDSTFTEKDSIIVADFQKRIDKMIQYQQSLENQYPIIKEYLGAEYIKNYLINSKNAIEQKKKNGKRK